MESKERLQVGTPRYMAPEIVMGKKTSTGVDIWALGVITYFMSTGEFPYDADT
jgi:serine/threonine protein kinase